LVGPPEDPLRLRLWLFLVPGQTRPCSGGDHLIVARSWVGTCMGALYSSSSSIWSGGRFRHLILVRSGQSQTSNTFTLIKCCAWVLEGPRSPLFWFMQSLELGTQRLDYGYALAASTLVDSPRHEFFHFVLTR
jgi:hypothetical protein